MFQQVMPAASVCLLLLSLTVSNGLGRNLYFGLILGEHDASGAKMGVDDALRRVNSLSSDYTLNSIELQVRKIDDCCMPIAKPQICLT